VITLVLGGARSGKSRVAEQLVGRLPPPVTYLATATVGDSDHAARVAVHRARRDPAWTTVETGARLVAALGTVTGSVLIDSLGTWVAAHDDFAVDVPSLVAALTDRAGSSVVVSEEVGLGVHPSSEAGRRFRDALGTVNAAVAAVCDDVVLVVAGRVLPLGRTE
jgi:adenosyl cobinamide kinase/adenosyl cobinamide phosphate guanylyltransferase